MKIPKDTDNRKIPRSALIPSPSTNPGRRPIPSYNLLLLASNRLGHHLGASNRAPADQRSSPDCSSRRHNGSRSEDCLGLPPPALPGRAESSGLVRVIGEKHAIWGIRGQRL